MAQAFHSPQTEPNLTRNAGHTLFASRRPRKPPVYGPIFILPKLRRLFLSAIFNYSAKFLANLPTTVRIESNGRTPGRLATGQARLWGISPWSGLSPAAVFMPP